MVPPGAPNLLDVAKIDQCAAGLGEAFPIEPECFGEAVRHHEQRVGAVMGEQVAQKHVLDVQARFREIGDIRRRQPGAMLAETVQTFFGVGPSAFAVSMTSPSISGGKNVALNSRASASS